MNSADIKENPAIGRNAVEFIDTLLTPEEIAESDFMVSLIEELIGAGITKDFTNPRLEEIIRALFPLGKTLAIVPISSVD